MNRVTPNTQQHGDQTRDRKQTRDRNRNGRPPVGMVAAFAAALLLGGSAGRVDAGPNGRAQLEVESGGGEPAAIESPVAGSLVIESGGTVSGTAVAAPDETTDAGTPQTASASPLTGLVAEIAAGKEQRVLKWESDIAAFEQLDADTPDPEDAVLFLGSSSIRLWTTMADDMQPWPVIRRGYGGASYLDLLHYAPRLVDAHDPRAVVLFAGNDIKGGAADQSPEQMLALFASLCPIVRKNDPDRDVFYIEVTPTPQRFHAWPQLSRANDLIRAYCETTPHTHYIGTRDIYLGDDGEPRAALFRDDNLHQNDEGYARWARRIKDELLRVLGTVRTE